MNERGDNAQNQAAWVTPTKIGRTIVQQTVTPNSFQLSNEAGLNEGTVGNVGS